MYSRVDLNRGHLLEGVWPRPLGHLCPLNVLIFKHSIKHSNKSNILNTRKKNPDIIVFVILSWAHKCLRTSPGTSPQQHSHFHYFSFIQFKQLINQKTYSSNYFYKNMIWEKTFGVCESVFLAKTDKCKKVLEMF